MYQIWKNINDFVDNYLKTIIIILVFINFLIGIFLQNLNYNINYVWYFYFQGSWMLYLLTDGIKKNVF